MPEPFHVDKSMTFEELMKMTADAQKRTWDQIAQNKAAAASATQTKLVEGISDQADWMAHQVKSDHLSGKRIGDVIDQMQRDHERSEGERFNVADHARRIERFASRITNTPNASRQSPLEPYQPAPFDRDAAYKTLVRQYPWLSPSHPDNPDGRWFRAVSERTNQQVKSLASGDMNAPANYRVGQFPHKST